MKLIALLFFPLLVGSNVSPWKRRLIVDTDAGADDALALTLLLNTDDVKVEAITTVTGNTGAYNVTQNVLKILSVTGKKIPVYQGTESGLIKTVKMEYYFGYDGFGDFHFEGPLDYSLIQEDHPAIAIADLVKKYPGEVTLLCLGPLTNIALATKLNSNLMDQVKEIIMVGGSYTGIGNVKPGIEFNMYGDPEAAALFFLQLTAKNKVTMVPLEVLEQGRSDIYSSDWEYFFSNTSSTAQFLANVWRYKYGDIVDPGDGLATFLTLYNRIPLRYITRTPQVEYQGSEMVRGITLMGEGNLVKIVQIQKNVTLCQQLVKCLTFKCNIE